MNHPVNRPSRSVEEIRRLPDLGKEEAVLHHLRAHGDELGAETLVFILRDQTKRGHGMAAGACAEYLTGHPEMNGKVRGGHCEHIVRRTARTFGFAGDPEDLKEFRARCYEKLAPELAGDDPYLEERFYRFLKWRAMDVGEVMRNEADRHASLQLDDPEPHERLPSNSEEDDLFSSLTQSELMTALRDLPRPERVAAWLAWVEDYQVESSDPTVQTVATTMGISGGMVRRHLRNARARLRSHPAVIQALGAISNRSRLES